MNPFCLLSDLTWSDTLSGLLSICNLVFQHSEDFAEYCAQKDLVSLSEATENLQWKRFQVEISMSSPVLLSTLHGIASTQWMFQWTSSCHHVAHKEIKKTHIPHLLDTYTLWGSFTDHSPYNSPNKLWGGWPWSQSTDKKTEAPEFRTRIYSIQICLSWEPVLYYSIKPQIYVYSTTENQNDTQSLLWISLVHREVFGSIPSIEYEMDRPNTITQTKGTAVFGILLAF